MNNVSVRLVFDRKHVATKKRQSSVQMEVTYQRKRKYVGTGIKLYSDQWGKDLKVKNHPQSLVFDQKLNDMVSGIYDFVYQLSSQNIPFTFERLERYLNNSESGTTNSFLSFMEKRIYERQVTDSTILLIFVMKISEHTMNSPKNDANASLRYIIITRY